jgi:hypothetical protein
VAQAADKESQRLAPLALIGARASAAQGQLGDSRPTYFWRTAAMVLFGVAVVLGIMVVNANRFATRSSQVAMNLDVTSTITDVVGSEFNSFIDDPYCNITRLEREFGNQDGYIRVAVNERFGNGYVFCLDLDDGEEIVIQGTTSTGEVIELTRITSSDSISGRAFELDKSLAQGIVIAAVNAKTGERWI